MRRIIFIAILFIILFIITSILLLIWWPVKVSLAEITNSWVALIMIYLVLIVFLFEKPIYKFYNEFIDIKKSGRHDSQQSKQTEIFGPISDSNLSELVSYYENIKWRFLYANNYLVLYAKYVLFWFYKSKSVKREGFDKVWQSKIIDPKERDAILNALLSVEFIRVEDDNLFITELGSAYVNYLKELDKRTG